MIVHLRPAALGSQGLAVALGKHVDVLRRTHKRDIALRITGEAPVPAAVETDAFRIAQEGLHNALRHAGPDASIAVELRCKPGHVELTVTDDGTGFDPSAPAARARAAGERIDLLVNNASTLGATPLPALADYPLDVLEHVFRVNAVAPLALAQLVLPRMAAGGRLINITSDAAVEGYEGWGGYGASKAALEQLSNVLAAERPDLRVYAVDPGDMNTRMQQEAFPGEDVSDRPPPQESVPGLLALVEGELASGRYRAAELAAVRA